MLQIEYLAIEDLKAYEKNAKLHPSSQIEQIKKSIMQFGMNDPIAIWKNNEIIEGHGRLMACLELGYDTVPVIRLDDLTDEQRKAYALVHNKLTMNSDFSIELLNQELDDITNINMADFGFDLGAIEIEDIDSATQAEEPIAKELGEANNYIVLEFFNEEDWEKAQFVFNLERVQTADKNKNIRRHGIGRVIDGAEIMGRLQNED